MCKHITVHSYAVLLQFEKHGNTALGHYSLSAVIVFCNKKDIDFSVNDIFKFLLIIYYSFSIIKVSIASYLSNQNSEKN